MANSAQIAGLESCWIYFYHLNQYVFIPFAPESISDSLSSTFNQTNALARSAPVLSYSNSGPRSVSFQIELHRESYDEVNKNNQYSIQPSNDTSVNDAVDELVKVLQAMALPKYDASNKGVVPPRVMVSIGDTIRIKGVVSGGVTVGYSKPIDFNESQGKYNCITVGFTVIEEDPYDAISVQQYGGFRPTTDPRNIE